MSAQGKGCEKFDLWFHLTPSCNDLNQQAIDTIKQFGGDDIAFFCTGCMCSVIHGQTSSVQDGGNVDQMFRVFKSLAESVAGLTSQVQKLLSIRLRFSRIL